MQYMAQIQGGVGPDVWDRDVFIDAADFMDAAQQASAKAEELNGQVTFLDQCDCSEAEALDRAVSRFLSWPLPRERATLAGLRGQIATDTTRLERLAQALAEDDGPAPITVLRQIRELEARVDIAAQQAEALERELAAYRPVATADVAEAWMGLIDGVEALDRDARLRAREMVRDSLSGIVLWHRGEPLGSDDGTVMDLEITARGGGTVRLRVDRSTGGLVAD